MTILKCEFIEVGRAPCGCCSTIAMWASWQDARDGKDPVAYFMFPTGECDTIGELVKDAKNCEPGIGSRAGRGYDPDLHRADVSGQKPN